MRKLAWDLPKWEIIWDMVHIKNNKKINGEIFASVDSFALLSHLSLSHSIRSEVSWISLIPPVRLFNLAVLQPNAGLLN